VRGAIRKFFETRTSYLCDEASDGLSAIRMAEENHCELVVLDLNMPNLNGVETAAVLRQKLPSLKIVGFSSFVSDADFRDALLATNNFDAVLAKSASLSRLAEVVRALIPEPAGS